jgi:hypothetical protein
MCIGKAISRLDSGVGCPQRSKRRNHDSVGSEGRSPSRSCRQRRAEVTSLLIPLVVLGCHLLLVLGARRAVADQQQKRQEWKWNPQDAHPCNIRRLTLSQFHEELPLGGLPALFPTPIVIITTTNNNKSDDTASTPRNEAFRNLTTRQNLLNNFPSKFPVTLSSSNSFSEHRRTVPFDVYLQEMLTSEETLPTQLSNESWYLFGETYGAGTYARADRKGGSTHRSFLVHI